MDFMFGKANRNRSASIFNKIFARHGIEPIAWFLLLGLDNNGFATIFNKIFASQSIEPIHQSPMRDLMIKSQQI